MKCGWIAPMYDQRLVQPEVPHATLNDHLESFGDVHLGPNRDLLSLGDLSTFVWTDRECRFNSAQRPIGACLRFRAFAFNHKANFVVHETSGEQAAHSYHTADGCSALSELITRTLVIKLS